MDHAVLSICSCRRLKPRGLIVGGRKGAFEDVGINGRVHQL